MKKIGVLCFSFPRARGLFWSDFVLPCRATRLKMKLFPRVFHSTRPHGLWFRLIRTRMQTCCSFLREPAKMQLPRQMRAAMLDPICMQVLGCDRGTTKESFLFRLPIHLRALARAIVIFLRTLVHFLFATVKIHGGGSVILASFCFWDFWFHLFSAFAVVLSSQDC